MPENSNPLDKIRHVVVLMLENRSFDNVFGWLYDPANKPPYDKVPSDFEGLSGKDLFNLMPGPNGAKIPAGKTTDPRSPQPNPGEPFEDVYSQIYDEAKVPFAQVPATPPHAANMGGFIRNYAVQKPAPTDPSIIMNSLTPETLPVLSSLAHNYAICDQWFASIPTQTFCNRSFVHAGTSSGYVNNGGGGHLFVNDTPTIFDLLEAAERSWNVFHGGWLIESFTFLTQKRLWKYALTPHFAHFKEFLARAAKKDGLPAYSFIEPVYFDSMVWGPQNDMHPEWAYEFYGPSSVHHGEELIWSIYQAIRNSPDWDSTLLLILFDEHGGCYDHVPPPSAPDCKIAIAPDKRIIPAGQPGGIGFKFDRLGPRVPAIAISAYTPPQTRLHTVFEHTSVLSTVVNCFTLPKDQLGDRAAIAADLSSAIRLDAPRSDKPEIAKPQLHFMDDVKAEINAIGHSRFLRPAAKPVSELQQFVLHAIAQMTESQKLHEQADTVKNELEADLLLMEEEAKLVKNKFL